MVKEIESFGIPAVHICSIVPISEAVGANRIVPAVGIPYPVGNPELSQKDEFRVRKELVTNALGALSTEIKEQTVF